MWHYIKYSIGKLHNAKRDSYECKKWANAKIYQNKRDIKKDNDKKPLAMRFIS